MHGSGNLPILVITVNLQNIAMHLPSVNDGWMGGDGEA